MLPGVSGRGKGKENVKLGFKLYPQALLQIQGPAREETRRDVRTGRVSVQRQQVKGEGPQIPKLSGPDFKTTVIILKRILSVI